MGFEKSTKWIHHRKENTFTNLEKLDGVAPLMTDPPPKSSITLSKKNKNKNKKNVTRDM